ncbi:VCBS repeat-containing protein [Lentzea alba]|uniref:FG-GAP repeat domain-containing protein n=1 Tax=Lentzea alba TaxID=2714351 RepID=UPI0039BF81CB
MRTRLLSAAALVVAMVSGLAGTASARPGDLGTTACTLPPDRDIEVTKVVHRVGRNLGVSAKVMLAGFEAGWVESHMNNLLCGDRDSLGVFQQRPSMGWGTPEQVTNVVYASNAFFTRAINSERNHPGFTAGQIAQDVQRSGFPDRYDQAETKARALIAEVATKTTRATNNDVTGDGFAELVVTQANGELFQYANSYNVNPARPYGARNRIGEGFGQFSIVRSADLTGDGYAELIAMRPNGELLFFENNTNANGGVPYGSGKWTGDGFNVFADLVLADVSGDGYADLLGIKPNGEVRYFPNSINGNPGRVPFATGGTPVGSGFDEFTEVRAADLTGDGHAELVAVNATGQLFYWENNMNTNPEGVPYLERKPAGDGFGIYSDFVLSDVSGDGYADLTAWKPSGEVFHYANNINANGRPFGFGEPIGEGFQIYDRLI